MLPINPLPVGSDPLPTTASPVDGPGATVSAPPVFRPYPIGEAHDNLLRMALGSALRLLESALGQGLNLAADALLRFVLQCVAGGHWPSPLTDPVGFETHLAAAADDAAAAWINLLRPDYGRELRFAHVLLLYLPLSGMRLGVADLLTLSATVPEAAERRTAGSPTPARIVAMGPNAAVTAAAAGFDVRLNWGAVGVRATRDALLNCVARKQALDQEWWMSSCVPRSPLYLTVRVQLPTPPVVVSPPVCGRRRRA